MVGELRAREVLRFGLHLYVAPGEVRGDEIVDRRIPHQFAVPAKLARLEAGGAELGIIRPLAVEQLRIEALARHRDMRRRPDTAPRAFEPLHPGIAELQILSAAVYPVMVKIDDERDLVRKWQEIVETE